MRSRVRFSSLALRSTLSAVALSALVSCGGGGGDDTPPPQPTGKISLGGVVSKGLTANADVRILSVSDDGVVNEVTPLATGVTNSIGAYETGQFISPSVYVVEVNAKPCADLSTKVGCSTHLDEATGVIQALPTGFRMRSVVSNTPDNRRINVTAITEWAYAMASTSAGGLTAEKVRRAVANVSSVLGVADINTVEPKPLAQASTDDEKRLAAMLAAVSRLADSNAEALRSLGCPEGTGPGTPFATQCVVQALANNTNGEKPTGDNVGISLALADQLQQVAATSGDPSLTALIAATKDKLTNTEVTYSQPITLSVYESIRLFFNDLTTTIKSLFDDSTGSATAAARQFRNAVDAVDADLDAANRTLSMSVQGMRLWLEFNAGSLVPRREYDGFYCALLSDMAPIDDQVVASNANPSTVAGVRCIQDITSYVILSPNTDNGNGTYTEHIRRPAHWFEITYLSGDQYQYVTGNSFADLDIVRDYTTHQEVSFTVVQAVCAQDVAQSDCVQYDKSGVITAIAANGSLSSLNIVGDAPDAWVSTLSGPALKNGNDSANFAGTTLNLNGQLQSPTSGVSAGAKDNDVLLFFYGDAIIRSKNGTTEVARIDIGTGSRITVIGDEGIYSKFVLTYLQEGTFKLQGTLIVDRTNNMPVNSGGKASFVGSLYNGSSTAPFVAGELLADVIRPDAYDPELPHSVTNFERINWTVKANVTAEASPKVRLILSSWGKITDDAQGWLADEGAGKVVGNYQVFNSSGAPMRDVTITGDVDVSGDVSRIVFSDSSIALGATYTRGVKAVPIYISGAERATISEKEVTMQNGEAFSLDLGMTPVW